MMITTPAAAPSRPSIITTSGPTSKPIKMRDKAIDRLSRNLEMPRAASDTPRAINITGMVRPANKCTVLDSHSGKRRSNINSPTAANTAYTMGVRRIKRSEISPAAMAIPMVN